MSSPGDGSPTGARQVRERFSDLEGAVDRLLQEVEGLRKRLDQAEERVGEMSIHLKHFMEGETEPAALLDRLHELEAHNEDLRKRIQEGRDGIERLLKRIRFLEEQGDS